GSSSGSGNSRLVVYRHLTSRWFVAYKPPGWSVGPHPEAPSLAEALQDASDRHFLAAAAAAAEVASAAAPSAPRAAAAAAVLEHSPAKLLFFPLPELPLEAQGLTLVATDESTFRGGWFLAASCSRSFEYWQALEKWHHRCFPSPPEAALEGLFEASPTSVLPRVRGIAPGVMFSSEWSLAAGESGGPLVWRGPLGGCRRTDASLSVCLWGPPSPSWTGERSRELRGKGPPVLCGLYRVSCGGLPSPQQIRAHFAAAGCPLVNDEAYSESSSSHTRDVDSGGNSTASEDPYGHQISGAQQEGPPLAVELCGSHADSEPFYPTLFSVTLAEGVNLQQKTPCDTRTAGVKQSSLTAASSSKKKEDSARCSTLGLQLCCLTFPDPLGPRMGQSFTVSVEGPPDWPQE
ncbi:uncharacterized protein LOC34621352, partial [Cyclospora cayetanensis]|uniref:Uncharacterized protein LOC34621352 n=1 Tax=Cyclospora cayetanensis TaxID=88456 RepID=A0A6P6RXU6_9EIME